ncbi:uncharacterized protein E5676_scaffold282G00110 [Cucumis melo var. makuwa]|uniref:Reverse transcriptase/retrotransposon-derived protein RNase H-like domain-containing protein n=1 Tax=Cucumis melo var. makuwa TaxID=1194695 RepID=A0A5D3B8U6_CUCMM|nr:uncharacterized protein E5676_scaffold282G00110 [Cucumis melo var. makuwa]
MKKDAVFDWDQSCQNAFDSIKKYLLNPPILSAPTAGKPLILYIVAQEASLGALLVQENDKACILGQCSLMARREEVELVSTLSSSLPRNICYHIALHSPLEPIHPTIASWPFEAWGLDLVGLIMPKSSVRYSYILYKSFMYNAATNGLAEAFNKTLCNLLKKVVSKTKGGWQEKIREALWAYRTTHRTSTVTPYSLVYGVEAVLSLEREISSLRMAIQEGLTTKDNAKLRLQELEAFDDKRLEAQQALECYQARMSKAFDKHVKSRSFQVGDLVLAVRRPIITTRHTGNKFTPK